MLLQERGARYALPDSIGCRLCWHPDLWMHGERHVTLQHLCLLPCFCSVEDPEGAGDARWRRDAQSDGVLPVPMPWYSARSAHIFQASHVTTFGISTCVRL